jgi:hypothetical protein
VAIQKFVSRKNLLKKQEKPKSEYEILGSHGGEHVGLQSPGL